MQNIQNNARFILINFTEHWLLHRVSWSLTSVPANVAFRELGRKRPSGDLSPEGKALCPTPGFVRDECGVRSGT